MNSYKTTLLFAIVLAALGIYLYTFELPSIEHEAQQQVEEKRLLPFDYRDVIDVTMATRDETVHMVRDTRGRWMIMDPIQTKGDAREIGGLLRALELGRVSRLIQEDSNDANRYGLAQPHVIITIMTPHSEETLALGDVEQISSTLYARRGSDRQILLTTLSVQDFRKKNLFSFRHKDVLFFDRHQVVELTITSKGKGQLKLHRIPSIHGSTSDWQFSYPTQGPANKTMVGLLLMTLEDLQAKRFIDSATEKTQLTKGFGEPDHAISIQTEQGLHQVDFFQSPSDGETGYAMTAPTEPIFAIDASAIHKLPRDIFDLQDRRLFGMTTDEIALLEVTTPTTSYTLIRQHGEWHLDDHPNEVLNQQLITLLVSRIVDLPAEMAVSRTRADLGTYGLAHPSIEVVGIDTKGRRRGYFALGKQESGLIYVLGAGLPGVYRARSLILTQIPDLEGLGVSAQTS